MRTLLMIAITTMLITSCNSTSESGRFQVVSEINGEYFDTKEGIFYHPKTIEDINGNRIKVMEIIDVRTGQVTIKDLPQMEDKRSVK